MESLVGELTAGGRRGSSADAGAAAAAGAFLGPLVLTARGFGLVEDFLTVLTSESDMTTGSAVADRTRVERRATGASGERERARLACEGKS